MTREWRKFRVHVSEKVKTKEGVVFAVEKWVGLVLRLCHFFNSHFSSTLFLRLLWRSKLTLFSFIRTWFYPTPQLLNIDEGSVFLLHNSSEFHSFISASRIMFKFYFDIRFKNLHYFFPIWKTRGRIKNSINEWKEKGCIWCFYYICFVLKWYHCG